MGKWKKSMMKSGWYSYRPSKKYSIENYISTCDFNSTDQPYSAGNDIVTKITLVDTTAGNVLGTRKCKNFTLKLSASNLAFGVNNPGQFILNDFQTNHTLWWALVYVPEGNDPSNLSSITPPNSTTLYEPNQNVIMCGHLLTGENKVFSTKLSRNLNYGDRIMLVIKQAGLKPAIYYQELESEAPIPFPTQYRFSALLSYAICFN